MPTLSTSRQVPQGPHDAFARLRYIAEQLTEELDRAQAWAQTVDDENFRLRDYASAIEHFGNLGDKSFGYKPGDKSSSHPSDVKAQGYPAFSPGATSHSSEASELAAPSASAVGKPPSRIKPLKSKSFGRLSSGEPERTVSTTFSSAASKPFDWEIRGSVGSQKSGLATKKKRLSPGMREGSKSEELSVVHEKILPTQSTFSSLATAEASIPDDEAQRCVSEVHSESKRVQYASKAVTYYRDADDSEEPLRLSLLDKVDSSEASGTFSEYNGLQKHEYWKALYGELSMWFDGITNPEFRALSPFRIQSIFVAIDGDCNWDEKWISHTVSEFKEAVKERLYVRESSVCRCSRLSTARKSLKSMKSFGRLQSDHSLGMLNRNISIPLDHLTFESFVELMVWHEVESSLSEDLKSRILQIREVLIRQSVEQLVLKFSHLTPVNWKKAPFWANLFDALVGLVVCVNAITVGLSTDSDWSGWDVLEYVFTTFYSFEIVMKVSAFGYREHFFGADRTWNRFDLCIVGVALFDLVMTAMGEDDSDLNNFTMIRIARLAKVTRLMRLIRLLRFRFFKELLLMVRGVEAGMRTIAWAFVLLATLVYMIAVLLRQTVGEDRRIVTTGSKDKALFHSMGWSISIAFRCLAGDCSLTDGTPLVGHLYDIYGYVFFVPYTVVVLFVIFGMFNLIMAVFVENVKESAQQKRQLTRDDERVLVVKKLSQLVMRCGSEASHEREPYPEIDTSVTTTSRSVQMSRSVQPMPSGMLRRFGWRIRRIVRRARATCPTSVTSSFNFQYGGTITRKMFNEVISQPDASYILDDLEIRGDRTELFDVIDAEGNGVVHVSDLISGLLKLRSRGADKSDMVTLLMGVRSIQKQVDRVYDMVVNKDLQSEFGLGSGRQSLRSEKQFRRSFSGALFTGELHKSDSGKSSIPMGIMEASDRSHIVSL